MLFRDREQAGNLLAEKVGDGDMVLAIPRGGVVVGEAVADKLGLPLGVVVTKKVGVPGQEELAVGAMDPDGGVIWDEELLMRLGLMKDDLAPQIKSAKLKIREYKSKFKVRSQSLEGKKVVLVDDGVATGMTVKAAISWLRERGVGRIIVAMPVCSREAYEKLKALADEVVCLSVPDSFAAVGQFYENFPQVSDSEIVGILGL